MMAFTAKDVKDLREKTGVGMMDCKNALAEADGDMEKAVTILREKGLASAAKKSTRVAAEGVVTALTNDKSGVLVEINCETDFVAGGDMFQELASKIAKTALDARPDNLDVLLETTCVDGEGTVADEVQEVFLKLRENMKVRRFALIDGHVVSYIHAKGTVGVLVNFDTDDETAVSDEFVDMGKNIAMQIAAMNPAYLSEADVPAEVIEQEKEINLVQMKEDPKMANKPAQVLEKIIEGKIAKYYKEMCLLNQEFVRGDIYEGDVKGYVASVAKALGKSITIKSFVRYEKGEGIEKKEENFAEEIAKMVNK
ncbi:MAG TPA: elongation factor Ts [Clostridiales bacterium]|nr:elongation factor Ts [Clostridiales bacterium]